MESLSNAHSSINKMVQLSQEGKQVLQQTSIAQAFDVFKDVTAGGNASCTLVACKFLTLMS